MAKTILFLAANPLNTDRLRLDEEVRQIKESLHRAKQREQFVLESIWAVRINDLRRAMLDHEPNIVHFSGHGASEDGIILEDNSGHSSLVSNDALQAFFQLFPTTECVVLNACFSEVQAEFIGQHVKYVIGMRGQIGDIAAKEFAEGFYDALGAGRTVELAFKTGRNAIQMANIPEHLMPRLITNQAIKEVNPNTDAEFEPQPNMEVDKSKTASWLQILDESNNELVPPTNELIIKIGRSSENMLVVSDCYVSWEHGQIVWMRGNYYYRHLSKTSSTQIWGIANKEGRTIRPGEKAEFPLQDQDRLIVGNNTFIIRCKVVPGKEIYIPTNNPKKRPKKVKK